MIMSKVALSQQVIMTPESIIKSMDPQVKFDYAGSYTSKNSGELFKRFDGDEFVILINSSSSPGINERIMQISLDKMSIEDFVDGEEIFYITKSNSQASNDVSEYKAKITNDQIKIKGSQKLKFIQVQYCCTDSHNPHHCSDDEAILRQHMIIDKCTAFAPKY